MKWACFTNVVVLFIVCRLPISKFHAMFDLWQTSLRLCLEKSRSFSFKKWFWKRNPLEQDEQTFHHRPGVILERGHFEMSILLFIGELLIMPVIFIYNP
jgi:hypothetical protein